MKSKRNWRNDLLRGLLACGLAAAAVLWFGGGASAHVMGAAQETGRFLLPAAAFEGPFVRGRTPAYDQRTSGRRSRFDRRFHAGRGNSGRQLYRQWQETPPEERNRLEKRMDQWKRMSPREKEQYRQRYRQYRRLPPKEQQRLRQELKRWDQLSPQERESIRRRFKD